MTPLQTAAPIAQIRSEEGARPEGERLFVDPYAHLFADGAEEVVTFFRRMPFFDEHVRLRTRCIDDTVLRALGEGIRSVVLIGAGFDCRALRLPQIAATGARVIEVDHADQLAEKRRKLVAASVVLPAHDVHAPADLSVPGELERALGAAGLPEGVPTLWVCEGLLGYLSRADLEDLARTTGRLSGPGSVLTGNHNVSSWSTEALTEIFAASSWRAAQAPSFAELHRAHLGPVLPDGHDTFAMFEATR